MNGVEATITIKVTGDRETVAKTMEAISEYLNKLGGTGINVDTKELDLMTPAKNKLMQ